MIIIPKFKIDQTSETHVIQSEVNQTFWIIPPCMN